MTRRVTLEQIQALIASGTLVHQRVGTKTTMVCLTLPNGFEVVETSACVDPANYNHDLGVEVCKRRLVDKLFLLEGYRLSCEG